jgi:hypothetical protein
VTAQAQRILSAARRRLADATHSKPPRTSGMEPERQRHRHVGRREQRRGDGERRADDRDLHLDPVREGERRDQLGASAWSDRAHDRFSPRDSIVLRGL